MNNNIFLIRNNFLKKIYSYYITQAIYIAAKYNIADHIANNISSISSLSEKTQIKSDNLKRLMRFLIQQGVFEENNKGQYINNDLSCCLLQFNENSLYHLALLHGSEFSWLSWGNAEYAFSSDISPVIKTFGVPAFEYLQKNIETSTVFNMAMTELAAPDARFLIEKYNFSSKQSIADVGGGYGTLLLKIKQAFPHLTCTLYDTKDVIKEAKNKLVTDLIKFRSGDFFKSIPSKKDVYIMRHIIHDWGDDASEVILKNCAKSMLSNSTLLLLEIIIYNDGNDKENIAIFRDLNMLVTMPNGRERTLNEYELLLKKAGLQIENIIFFPTQTSIIECKKIG